MAAPGMAKEYRRRAHRPKGYRNTCQPPGFQHTYSGCTTPAMYSMGSSLLTGSRNSGGSVGVQFSTSNDVLVRFMYSMRNKTIEVATSAGTWSYCCFLPPDRQARLYASCTACSSSMMAATASGITSTANHLVANVRSGTRHSGAVISMFRLKAENTLKSVFSSAGHTILVRLNMDSTCR